VVTPTSTEPALRPRRPRHRADAASCLVVWIFVLVRPRSPTGKPVVDQSFEVTWWYEHQEALGSRWWWRPPRPSSSSGSRRPRHRAGAASRLAVWSFLVLSGFPFHLRQAGGGPDPGHLRPKPSLTRVPCRLRRTGCSLGP